MANISRAAAIVGAAESDELGYLENRKSDLQLLVEAASNALDDAGLKKGDVDAIFSSGNTMGFAEHMGIIPRFTDGTSVGGSSFVIHAGHALAAIAAGYCETALVVHGSAGHSRRFFGGGGGIEGGGPASPGRPVRDALRVHRRSHQLLDGVRAVYARVWRGPLPRGDVGDSGVHPQVGGPQSQGPHPRPGGRDTSDHVL